MLTKSEKKSGNNIFSAQVFMMIFIKFIVIEKVSYKGITFDTSTLSAVHASTVVLVSGFQSFLLFLMSGNRGL